MKEITQEQINAIEELVQRRMDHTGESKSESSKHLLSHFLRSLKLKLIYNTNEESINLIFDR